VDIEMPGRSGLELAAELRMRGVMVVFVTAFAEHAPAAFDLDAADYLLKPFDGERLERALDRVRRELDARPRPVPRPASRLAVDMGGRVRLIAVSAIDWIEADGRRVVLHIGRESVPHRETMRAVEARLDPEQFARIHRGAIVRIAAIREMWPAFHGDWVVALENGEQLVMSRRYRRRF
jgi:two-component system LytT family response regulator